MDELVLAERIRQAYAAFNRGDLDAVLELLDEEVELRPPPTSLEPQPLQGREAVREYLLPNLFEVQTAEPTEIIPEGDRVLVVARTWARGRGSGVELDTTAFHLWTIEGDRVVRFEVYIDREQAFAALRADTGPR
jgi:ketosteroid isomerase-like protein